MFNCDKKYLHHCYYIAIAQVHQKARKITAYKELEIILPNFNRLKLTNIYYSKYNDNTFFPK